MIEDLRVAGLFSGVGLFEHACQTHGMEIAWSCENDDFCRRILDLRFPETKHYGDVTSIGVGREVSPGPSDVIVGGFPCQGASNAGNRLGLADPRTGLWSEFARLIAELHPRLVVIENVAALRSRGMGIVVSNLLSLGYDCYWDCVPAIAVGAPHLRDRVWIIAAPAGTLDLPEPKHTRKDPLGLITSVEKLPRAGAASGLAIWECEPRATIRECKEAMGAVKKDGVTWLTKIGSPLFPTPAVAGHVYNIGWSNGRNGKVKFSLQTMAEHEAWPDVISDVQTDDGADFRLSDLESVTREQRVWKTPQSGGGGQRPPDGTSATGRTEDGRKLQVGLAHEVAVEEQSLWPTPSAAAAAQGPSREGRAGGPNLRTSVAERDRPGPLSPYWVSWLMGVPIGWVDLEWEDPIQLDWLSEYDIPRVLRDVPLRRQQLQALGNSLVWGVAYVVLEEALSRLR